ncbi:hypothetical protein ACFL10_01370 [Patescibacteria group bacterium]
MFYTKIIFRSGTKPTQRPGQAPPLSPGQKAQQLSQRVKKNIDTKKAAAESLRKNRADLFERWKKNNPESKEVLPDDPKSVAVNFITNSKRAKEAYLLMSLIEKYWKPGGKKKSWTLFLASKRMKNKPGDINFTPFERFFSESNAGPKLGFYFWEKKNKWYAVDVSGKDKADEPMSEFLLDSNAKLKSEFTDKANKDSGLTTEMEQDILRFWDKSAKEGGKLVQERQSNRGKGLVKSFFKKQAENKWKRLDQNTATSMNVIFGAGVGRYMYRYVPGTKPEKDRIFMILINGEKAHKNLGPAGYIEVDKDGLGKWNAYDSVDKLKPNLLSKMDPNLVSAELGRQRLQAGEKLSKPEKLKQTKGDIAGKFPKLATKVIPFHELRTYYDDLRKKLRGAVKKKGIKKNVEAIVDARVKDIEDKIKDRIKKNDILRKAEQDKPKIEIIIRIDSNDDVTVTFKDPDAKNNIQKIIDTAKEKGTSVTDLAKDVTTQLYDKMKKIFGKGAPIAMWIAKKFLKLEDGIKTILSGGSAPIAAMALGALGITVTPLLVGARKMNKKKFDKFLADSFKDPKIKEKKVTKKLTLTQDYRLNGYSIVIPKGKGVILKPGAKLKTKSGVLEGAKADKKIKSPFGKLSFGKSKSNVLGKDQEIVIPNNTVIPKGTIINSMKIRKA